MGLCFPLLLGKPTLNPLPAATPPSCYRLDQQLQVPGLKCVLILRVQVFKLLQEAQVIQLYIWMKGKRRKKPQPIHRMFFISKYLSWAQCALKESQRLLRQWGSPEDGLTELGAIREGFLKEVMPQLSLMLQINNYNNN